MTIKVLDRGLLTTVQDLGRRGFQKDGVPVSGAMDQWSLRLANLLVGNAENEAGLEITMIGPTLHFEKDVLISITGANLSPTINGKQVPMFRPVLIKMGSVLKFSQASDGCRTYLAIAGGINVPTVLRSKSTFIPAGLGGVDGRAIVQGDIFQIKETHFIPTKGNWGVSPRVLPKYTKEWILHILPGPEIRHFSSETLNRFFSEPFKLSPQSNRMGFRLTGPQLKLEKEISMLSSPVFIGTIQVPTDGEPIILMADCQTTGGYPRIGHVIQADLHLLAQAKPGDTFLFKPMKLEEAYKHYFYQEMVLQTIKLAIKVRREYGAH